MTEFFLDSTSKPRNGRRQSGCTTLTNSVCVSVWFTLISLQLRLLETISETRGLLTGAAARPGRRKISWSPSGFGSPVEIWENNRIWSVSNLVFTHWPGFIHVFYFKSWTLQDIDNKLTGFSVCPKQRRARSCPLWSRRFHYFGDPF